MTEKKKTQTTPKILLIFCANGQKVFYYYYLNYALDRELLNLDSCLYIQGTKCVVDEIIKDLWRYHMSIRAKVIINKFVFIFLKL